MDFEDDDRFKEDKEEVNDILPDTNIERDRTLSGKWALFLLCLAGFLTTLAFVAPNWVEGDPRFYGNKLDKLGLWVHCFRSIPDYNDQRHQRYFAGCRWIFNPFTKGYGEIRNYLVPPFFVATQFFYTLSFIAILVAIILVLMYLLCVDDYYRVSVLRWTGIDLIVAGALANVALVIFGAKGDNRDFMPDWENNYLSWAFGLGCVAALFDYIAGVLFIVEARIIARKEIAREHQFPMEKAV